MMAVLYIDCGRFTSDMAGVEARERMDTGEPTSVMVGVCMRDDTKELDIGVGKRGEMTRGERCEPDRGCAGETGLRCTDPCREDLGLLVCDMLSDAVRGEDGTEESNITCVGDTGE